MVGRRILVMGFGACGFSAGATAEIKTSPSVPVYVDRFLMPADLWRSFPSIAGAKIGGQDFDELEFTAIPDNPRAVCATPPKLVRVRAGEPIVLTMTNYDGVYRVLRVSAMVFADDEAARP